MPNPTWPLSLPVFVLEQGYDENLPENTVETTMDIGPAKIRRRFTAVFRKFSVVMQFDAAQQAIFEDFYVTTCAGGAIPFDWVHPRTRAAMTFRFRKPGPKVMSIGSIYTRTGFTIEQYP